MLIMIHVILLVVYILKTPCVCTLENVCVQVIESVAYS